MAQPIEDKDARTATHKIIREVFSGVLESTAKQMPGEQVSRLAIKFTQGRPQSNKDFEKKRQSPCHHSGCWH